MKHGMIAGVPVAAMLIILAGCYPATFQTASVLERGQKAVGFGTGFRYEHANPGTGWSGVTVADLYYRAGLGNGLEMGARYSMPFRVLVDGRYQAVRRPVLFSVGAGLAYTYDFMVGSPNENNHLLDVVTVVLVGREHELGNRTLGYHIGAKPIPLRLTPSQSPREVPRWGAVVGGCYGGRLKVAPELNVYWGSYQRTYPPSGTLPLAFSPCLALQFTF